MMKVDIHFKYKGRPLVIKIRESNISSEMIQSFAKLWGDSEEYVRDRLGYIFRVKHPNGFTLIGPVSETMTRSCQNNEDVVTLCSNGSVTKKATEALIDLIIREIDEAISAKQQTAK